MDDLIKRLQFLADYPLPSDPERGAIFGKAATALAEAQAEIERLRKTNDNLTRLILTGRTAETPPVVHYLFGKPLEEIAAMIDAALTSPPKDK